MGRPQTGRRDNYRALPLDQWALAFLEMVKPSGMPRRYRDDQERICRAIAEAAQKGQPRKLKWLADEMRRRPWYSLQCAAETIADYTGGVFERRQKFRTVNRYQHEITELVYAARSRLGKPFSESEQEYRLKRNTIGNSWSRGTRPREEDFAAFRAFVESAGLSVPEGLIGEYDGSNPAPRSYTGGARPRTKQPVDPDLQAVARDLITYHGGLRHASRALGVSYSTLKCLNLGTTSGSSIAPILFDAWRKLESTRAAEIDAA